MIRVAGIVLCGGQSRRMGRPKAWLPFQAETMLQRVVRQVSEAVQPVWVVAAVGQVLPELPDTVRVVRDQREQAGPLEGLRAGLAAVATYNLGTNRPRRIDEPRVDPGDEHRVETIAERPSGLPIEAVFATGCDTPLLRPEWIRFLAGELGTQEAAVPLDGGHFHPLSAVYRIESLARIETLLAQGESRLTALCAQLRTRAIPVDRLRLVDPQLESLINVNCPEEYIELRNRP
ncbi:MAG: Molybdenum cofactor guanylyltransferase [Planctomycetota bacterium]|jgi:molybdopterin-guanine dinucleotide biosynthesis protein A